MERQEGLYLPKGEALMLASCFQAQWQSAICQVYLQTEILEGGYFYKQKKNWVTSGKPLETKLGILYAWKPKEDEWTRSLLRQHCSKDYADVVWRCPC